LIWFKWILSFAVLYSKLSTIPIFIALEMHVSLITENNEFKGLERLHGFMKLILALHLFHKSQNYICLMQQ